MLILPSHTYSKFSGEKETVSIGTEYTITYTNSISL